MRYQIGTMERVLENAVEHGASLWRDRLQALAPVEVSLLDSPRVRGYRIDDYGLFFDVEVPSGEMALFSAFRTLDQNGLGLQSAMSQVKAFIQAQAAGNANVQQAMRRIELQMGPAMAGASLAAQSATIAPSAPQARTAAGSTVSASTFPGAAGPGATVSAATVQPAVQAAVQAPAPPTASAAPGPSASDAILVNPEEAYRAEVMRAVIDALIDYSAPLGLDPSEWLTVGVRRNEVRPRIGLDTNAQTFIARVRGSDLAAFRTGQLTRQDAIKRVELRVF
jgi:hypothetical protein